MEEVRVNVRSRGGSSGKPDFEVLHPRFPSFPRRPISRLPHRHPSHPPPVFSHFLVASSSLGLGDLQEQAGVASRRGWRRDERGGRGGGRGLSLSLDQYSHLLPAGPGRTLRSEAHLLADIQPPFLRNRTHPPPPQLVHPSLPSFPSRRDGLLAGQPSRRTLAICIRRDELRLSQRRKFFASLPYNLTMDPALFTQVTQSEIVISIGDKHDFQRDEDE